MLLFVRTQTLAKFIKELKNRRTLWTSLASLNPSEGGTFKWLLISPPETLNYKK
jgi:hypothetical protein